MTLMQKKHQSYQAGFATEISENHKMFNRSNDFDRPLHKSLGAMKRPNHTITYKRALIENRNTQHLYIYFITHNRKKKMFASQIPPPKHTKLKKTKPTFATSPLTPPAAHPMAQTSSPKMTSLHIAHFWMQIVLFFV